MKNKDNSPSSKEKNVRESKPKRPRERARRELL
jgi:hypothetical protein